LREPGRAKVEVKVKVEDKVLAGASKEG